MRKSCKILLELLGSPSDIDLRNVTHEQWSQVVDMAFEQGVAAIAVDGLQRSLELRGESLEGNILESEELEDLRYELFGEALACEEDYRIHKEKISRLAEFYKSNGIKMMLLKGYGLSLNYPVPAHRTCGDIDVYLYGKGDEADKLVTSRLGIPVNYENPKHSVFSFEGVTVENHYTFTDVLESRANLMTEKVLEKYLDGAVESGLGCYLPSNEWNYIFLLRHLAEHFGTRKSVNIRQLIDWGFFLKQLPKDFDEEKIMKELKGIGLEMLNNLTCSLAETILGENFSSFISRRISEQDLNKVFEDIFYAPKMKISEKKILGFIQKILCDFTQRWKYKYLPENYLEKILYRYKEKTFQR